MEQYIPKSALVAEIERLEKKNNESENVYDFGTECALKSILSFIDTLEVKEVDLKSNSFDATVCKIGSTYLKEMERDAIVKALEPYKDGDKVKVIIKAQKGE